jgi:hypothetical protein
MCSGPAWRCGIRTRTFFFRPAAGRSSTWGRITSTTLVNLIGPVKRVVALANRAREERIITNGPRNGEALPVVVATNIHAILEFVSGAQISLMASWDVWAHRHQNMELYGTDGAVFVPDPNFFGGTVEVAGNRPGVEGSRGLGSSLTAKNYEFDWGTQANYRGIGLADMMEAVTTGRDYRCSLDRSLHTIDVLTAILRSADEGRAVDIRHDLHPAGGAGHRGSARLLLRVSAPHPPAGDLSPLAGRGLGLRGASLLPRRA